MTVHTLPAGTTNIAAPAIDAFFDKTDPRGWIIRPGDVFEFPPNSSATLVCDNHKSIWNKGTLRMRPASGAIVHHIEFKNIDQTKWVSSQLKGCPSATVSGTTVTYTVNPNEDPVVFPGITSHNFEVGDAFVASTTFAPAQYRGTFIVTARTPTTISCINATPPVGPATALGTIRATGVITNDTGVWTTAGGHYDIQGTPKKAWTRAAATIPTGATSVVCDDALTGWRAGDVVYIVPTGKNLNKDHLTGRNVLSVSGNTVTFSDIPGVPAGPATAPIRHEAIQIPAITRPGMVSPARHFGAELLNVTRNVRFSGQIPANAQNPVDGRLHMANMDLTTVQTDTFNYVELFNIGPPGVGRWAFHYHKVGAARAGTVCEGVVARNGGVNSHTFVQHASDGITLKDCIAFNVDSSAYWWDLETAADLPNTGMWDRCVAVHITSIMKNDYRMSGFNVAQIGQDQGFTLRDCVVACVEDAGLSMNGFGWPEEGFPLFGWNVEGENVSHNNPTGLFTWWNTNVTQKHPMPGFVLYRNYKRGAHIGAYNNSFRSAYVTLYDNGTYKGVAGKDQNHLAQFEALSTPNDDYTGDMGRNQYFFIDCAGRAVPAVDQSESVNGGPIYFHDVEIVNAVPPFFFMENANPRGTRSLEFIRVAITPTATGVRRDILPSDVAIDSVEANSYVRSQSLDDQSSWRIDFPTRGNGSDKIIQTGLPPFAPRVTTQSLPNAPTGVAYSQALAAVANSPTWILVDGTTLPPGLSLSTAGIISGTPTTNGVYNFTVQATATNGIDAPKALSINVGSSVTLQITTSSLDGAVLGDAYSDTLAATGGFPPYSFAVTSGSLPPGLTLNPSGIGVGNISGTPSTEGAYFPTFVVTDSTSATGPPKQLGITVQDLNPIITTPAINSGEQGITYTFALQATGGSPAYTFSLILGPLPPGASMSSAGVLSGTPTASGNYPVRIRVTDTAAHFSERDYTITMFTPFSLPDQTLAPASVGQTYSDTVEVAGGAAPISFTAISGPPLPEGLSLSTSGSISGIPTQEGDFAVNVTATDRFGAVDIGAVSITVGPSVFVTADEVSRDIQRSFAQRRPHGGSRQRDLVK